MTKTIPSQVLPSLILYDLLHITYLGFAEKVLTFYKDLNEWPGKMK